MPGRKILIAAFAILMIFAGIRMADAFTPNPKALKDSKSEKLTAIDQAYLRYDTINFSSITKAKVLVNRVTGVVEYVFLNDYKRYVRPKFVMPDAQVWYDKGHRK